MENSLTVISLSLAVKLFHFEVSFLSIVWYVFSKSFSFLSCWYDKILANVLTETTWDFILASSSRVEFIMEGGQSPRSLKKLVRLYSPSGAGISEHTVLFCFLSSFSPGQDLLPTGWSYPPSRWVFLFKIIPSRQRSPSPQVILDPAKLTINTNYHTT